MCKLKNKNMLLCLFLSFTWRNVTSKLKKTTTCCYGCFFTLHGEMRWVLNWKEKNSNIVLWLFLPFTWRNWEMRNLRKYYWLAKSLIWRRKVEGKWGTWIQNSSFFNLHLFLEMSMKDVSYKFGTELEIHSKFHRLIWVVNLRLYSSISNGLLYSLCWLLPLHKGPRQRIHVRSPCSFYTILVGYYAKLVSMIPMNMAFFTAL